MVLGTEEQMVRQLDAKICPSAVRPRAACRAPSQRRHGEATPMRCWRKINSQCETTLHLHTPLLCSLPFPPRLLLSWANGLDGGETKPRIPRPRDLLCCSARKATPGLTTSRCPNRPQKGWRRWTGRTERGPRKDTARGRQRKTKQNTESSRPHM